MRRIAALARQAHLFIGFALVAAIALALILTLSGQRVSTTFSMINSGLSGGGGGGYVEEAPVGGVAGSSDPLPAAPGAPAQERLVISNASLSIEAADVTQADTRIRALINEAGGFVSSASTYGEGPELSVSLSTRVPAARFDATLSAIQGLAAKVRSRSVSGQDVTEEFVDLKARLHNLEITRDRVEAMMVQAKKIDEMLQINATLSDLQGQIEQIQGRMNYLSQSAALSTIDVSIAPVPLVPIVSEGSWQPVAVARGALRDVIATGQGLLNLVIVLGVWTPLIAPPLLLAWWVWRRLRRGAGRPGAG